MKTKLLVWGSWITFLVSAVAEWGFDFDLPLTPGLWLAIALITVAATTARAAQTVTHVSAGSYHTLFVESDGSLWTMGDNNDGQLGIGLHISHTNIPIQVVSSNVTAISAGGYHSTYLGDGGLWVFGDNEAGELGDGTTNNEYSPENITLSGVNEVAAGVYHTLFRTSSGHPITTIGLWATGDNLFGALGDGTTTNRSTPEETQSTQVILAEVTAISGGLFHSLFLKNTTNGGGSLWAMGNNGDGELGDGTTVNRSSPVEIVASNVVAIAAGSYHSLFIRSDGSLWAMGANLSGQLGNGGGADAHSPIGPLANNVTAIAAGDSHSLYIKSDGSLWGMGDNSWGDLGDGTTSQRVFAVEIVASNVVEVAGGFGYSLFIKSDGSLWGMGLNNMGQLGDGTNTDRHFPVRIVPPPPAPVLTSFSLAGTNVVLNATNGILGGTYFTLMSTNMDLPLNQWTTVAINTLSADGNFSIIATNAHNPAARQQFFVIKLLY